MKDLTILHQTRKLYHPSSIRFKPHR